MTVRITDISSDGKGIGRTEEGRVVFVPGTLPGDLAEIEMPAEGAAEKRSAARLLSIPEPSTDRVEPPCRYFGECGGCPLMGMSYTAQLKLKQRHVKDALERIGGFKEGTDYILEPILSTSDGPEMPLRYRNKAEFAIRGNRIGCSSRGGRDIVEAEDCVIQDPAAAAIIAAKRLELKPTQKYFTRLVLRFGTDGEIMTVTENRDGGYTADHRIIHGLIKTGAGTLKTEISPESFYQVNSEGCSILYTKAQEYAALTGSERLLDLYCGAGSIGLSMAVQCSRVIGVESVRSAVIDANRNAVINGIVNATFICGRAEDVIDTKLQGVKADVVVVDPPRAGCKRSLLDAIKRIAPKRLVYVSCDPATLARDLKILCEDGSFHLEKAAPVDMFPGTLHVETVVLMTKTDDGEK